MKLWNARLTGLLHFVIVLGLLSCSVAKARDAAIEDTIIGHEILRALVSETSGTLAQRQFTYMENNFSGYAPSKGADDMAAYMAARLREWGLEDVKIEKIPSSGKGYIQTFKSEPWWEGEKAEVWLTAPNRERIASFDEHRAYLARYSSSAKVESELVDVGFGTTDEDYVGKDVAGKVVLVKGSGRATFGGSGSEAHAKAVWEHGAAGILAYRTTNADEFPDQIMGIELDPNNGPNGEQPGFAIALPYRTGKSLQARLDQGEALRVSVDIQAKTRSGSYPFVHGIIKGTHPEEPEIWIQAHSNYRNSGGGNNLSGVGATMDLARSLARLVDSGAIPRPRRSIRFTWGAEHFAVIGYFDRHPEKAKDVLAYFSVDLVGLNQERSTLRLFRTPHSRPSFFNDIVQEMFEFVGEGNLVRVSDANGGLYSGYRFPILDPGGSKDPFRYLVEPFMGPSDNEDVVQSGLGIDAIVMVSWPHPLVGGHSDTVELTDATQLKRVSVLTGAAALTMAYAGPEEIPVLVQNAWEKARGRLASEESRAMTIIRNTSQAKAGTDLWKALNIVSQSHRLEVAALESLKRLDYSGSAENEIERAADRIEGMIEPARSRIVDEMSRLSRVHGWETISPDEPAMSPDGMLKPKRTEKVNSPVNLFRSAYGNSWLKEQLGDDAFLAKIPLARRGPYVYFEVLNFSDGTLTIQEIQERVAAEFDLIPIEEIVQYLRMMEKAGVIEFE